MSIQPEREAAIMWSDHMRLEERSLALHSEIARRLSAHPELLETAKKNLARWVERDGEFLRGENGWKF